MLIYVQIGGGGGALIRHADPGALPTPPRMRQSVAMAGPLPIPGRRQSAAMAEPLPMTPPELSAAQRRYADFSSAWIRGNEATDQKMIVRYLQEKVGDTITPQDFDAFRKVSLGKFGPSPAARTKINEFFDDVAFSFMEPDNQIKYLENIDSVRLDRLKKMYPDSKLSSTKRISQKKTRQIRNAIAKSRKPLKVSSTSRKAGRTSKKVDSTNPIERKYKFKLWFVSIRNKLMKKIENFSGYLVEGLEPPSDTLEVETEFLKRLNNVIGEIEEGQYSQMDVVVFINEFLANATEEDIIIDPAVRQALLDLRDEILSGKSGIVFPEVNQDEKEEFSYLIWIGVLFLLILFVFFIYGMIRVRI